jgi:hypothetical protein
MFGIAFDQAMSIKLCKRIIARAGRIPRVASSAAQVR